MRRFVLFLFAVLALSAGAWFLVRTQEGTTRPLAGAEPRARTDVDAVQELAPVLVGRSPGSGVPRAPGEPEDAPSTAGTAPEPATAGEPSSIEALIQRVQVEVEPKVWLPPGESRILPQGGSNLVVKARRQVQEGVHELLERLREAALRDLVASPPIVDVLRPKPTTEDPVEREAGEVDLRRILREMLAQWRRLEEALRAREAGRTVDAVRALDEVLMREPDHRAAAAYREALLNGPPPRLLEMDAGGLETGPYEPVERPIRALQPTRIPRWVLLWPSGKTFVALLDAAGRAGLGGWTFTGEARERRLRLPAPSVPLSGLPVDEALLRLSIATLIDLDADPGVTLRPAGRGLPPLTPTNGSLGALLEAVGSAVGPGLRFVPYPTVLSLEDPRQPPRLEVQIHDVSDLVEPPPR